MKDRVKVKRRRIVAPFLLGAGLLGATLSGCHSSASSVSPAEQAQFKGSTPPAGMAQSMQQAQQNWLKRHPGSATTGPGVPPRAGAPGGAPPAAPGAPPAAAGK